MAFDYVQERVKEREYDDGQRYSGVTMLSSKDAARTLAVRKKLTDVFADILAGFLPAHRTTEVRKWMAELKNRDISGMLSDEKDLVLTISQITMRPDKTLQFRFIDGRTLKTGTPKYSRKDDEVTI